MSLGHLKVPENKEELKEKNNGGMQKGASLQELPKAKHAKI